MSETGTSTSLVSRFQRWVVWALVIGMLLYLGGSIWAGAGEVASELKRFAWSLAIPVLGLTLVNYALRFLKWHYLMRVLGVEISWKEDCVIFIAGLSMVISPGKVGEVLKPYLVTRRTGVPMSQTLPALIAERLTDGIAIIGLAAISIGSFASDKVAWLIWPSVAVVLGLAVLASERLSLSLLSLLGRLPGVRKIASRLEEAYRAMRVCLAPFPLLATIVISVVAWWAECIGFQLVFQGLGESVGLDAATFLYAFATVAGGAFPGGIGGADAALAGGATTIVGVSESVALCAALLIRVATLWFGVLLGALALLRLNKIIEGGVAANLQDGSEHA
ncbi:MAG: lysylphosphatidylglycerol synthase transmembrane domain-containing protein [Myxococcota bacterium]|nr:lysylphosphatidylglycerol synthase transmembrane domain-containing protein [Myxococcota bacterium]